MSFKVAVLGRLRGREIRRIVAKVHNVPSQGARLQDPQESSSAAHTGFRCSTSRRIRSAAFSRVRNTAKVGDDSEISLVCTQDFYWFFPHCIGIDVAKLGAVPVNKYEIYGGGRFFPSITREASSYIK